VIILVKSFFIIRSIGFYFDLDFVEIEDEASAGQYRVKEACHVTKCIFTTI
jgi:hypothetical protein